MRSVPAHPIGPAQLRDDAVATDDVEDMLGPIPLLTPLVEPADVRRVDHAPLAHPQVVGVVGERGPGRASDPRRDRAGQADRRVFDERVRPADLVALLVVAVRPPGRLG